MVRIRIPGGVMPTGHARGAGPPGRPVRRGLAAPHHAPEPGAALGRPTASVPALLDQIDGYGLSTRSACGHTVRNVMASEDAGVGPRRAVRLPARRPPDVRRPDRSVGRAERVAAGPDEHRPRRLAAMPARRAGQRHRPRVDGPGRRRRLRGLGRRQPRQGAVAGRAARAVRAPHRRASPPSRRSSTCSSPTATSTSRPRAA